MKRLSILIFSLALAAPLGLSQTQESAPADVTLRENLRGLTGASYFLALANMAGLIDTLEADGPFTIFVPADDAFVYMPGDAFEALMANPDELLQVLSYHIVEGRYTAEDLLGLESLTTLHGETLRIDRSDAGPTLNDASIVQADLEASNGIIHVIDAVLRPDAGDISPPN